MGIGLGVVVAMFWLGLALVSNRQPPGREGDDDHGSGPSGGGPGQPGPDGGDAPGSAPAWWAEFERQFAAYVEERKATLPQFGTFAQARTHRLLEYDLKPTVTADQMCSAPPVAAIADRQTPAPAPPGSRHNRRALSADRHFPRRNLVCC